MKIEFIIAGVALSLTTISLLCASSLPAKETKELQPIVIQQKAKAEPVFVDPYRNMSDKERMNGVVLEPTN